jgi:hypothetical protein
MLSASPLLADTAPLQSSGVVPVGTPPTGASAGTPCSSREHPSLTTPLENWPVARRPADVALEPTLMFREQLGVLFLPFSFFPLVLLMLLSCLLSLLCFLLYSLALFPFANPVTPIVHVVTLPIIRRQR